MAWNCAAIDHGVTVYPNGKIGPCCRIKADYLKPISKLADPNRFADLKTDYPPSACESCISAEDKNISSPRHFFNNSKTSAPGLQFVDIRNTNLCNLKCRYCGPHFSSQWAKELGSHQPVVSQDLTDWKSTLITESLHWMYFTGGEPIIGSDHWNILKELVDNGQSSNIKLQYNSNLTVLRYKDVDIQYLWKKFKSVTIYGSIDAVGQPLEYIRSGASWQEIDQNIQLLKEFDNITLILAPVINILNFWFLPELIEYASQQKLSIAPIVLQGPDYLALNVIPDQLKSQALDIFEKIKNNFSSSVAALMKSMIDNNDNQVLFAHTMNHVLILDAHRQEKLYQLLPFKDIATDLFIKNHEYE